MKWEGTIKHFTIVLLFFILTNGTYLLAYFCGYIEYKNLFTFSFFINRVYFFLVLISYVYSHSFIIKKWIDGKLSFLNYFFQFHVLLLIVLLLIFILRPLFIQNFNADKKLNNAIPAKDVLSILFYYYFYINFMIGILFLPEILSKYKLRNEKLEIEVQEKKALSIQNNLFIELFSDSLSAIKNQKHKEKRESQIIDLSDFLRFNVYETEDKNISMSKAILILKLYKKIINSTYSQIDVAFVNHVKQSHFNLATKKMILQLQKFTQSIIKNNKITNAKIELISKPNNLITFHAQLYSNSEKIFDIEEVVN